MLFHPPLLLWPVFHVLIPGGTCVTMTCGLNAECFDANGTIPGICKCLDHHIYNGTVGIQVPEYTDCYATCSALTCGLNTDCYDEDSTAPANCTCMDGYIIEGGVNDVPEGVNCSVECTEADGFFKVPESGNQCFKFFPDSALLWGDSKSLCHTEGLLLAKPEDPATAIALRKYMVETYGDKMAWLGARGAGRNCSSWSCGAVKWDRDGTTLSHYNDAWYARYPGGFTSTTFCLKLMSDNKWLKNAPTQPYYMDGCSWSGPPGGYLSPVYALCELVM